MGVLDKFLDIMKLSDDEDYEDDFYDDEDYDSPEEKQPKKSLFRRDKRNDDFDDEPEAAPVKSSKPAKSSITTTNSKVTPMRQPAARKNALNMEVCVIKPASVDDSREITETLLSGRTVILNLEGIDLEIAQRIIDFTSGATYAIDGNLQKISNYIFLITPNSVEISGDLQDLLNTSFDASSMRTRF